MNFLDLGKMYVSAVQYINDQKSLSDDIRDYFSRLSSNNSRVENCKMTISGRRKRQSNGYYY